MDDKLTPRAKRLLVILMVFPFLYLAVYYGTPLLNTQGRNLYEIKKHIEEIQPQWRKFKLNTDFKFVEIFAYTGENGLLGVYGMLPSEESFKGQDVVEFDSLDDMFESWEK